MARVEAFLIVTGRFWIGTSIGWDAITKRSQTVIDFRRSIRLRIIEAIQVRGGSVLRYRVPITFGLARKNRCVRRKPMIRRW